jgi:hypothetical protein
VGFRPYEAGEEGGRARLGDDGEPEDAVVRAVADVRVEPSELAADPVRRPLPAGAGVARGPRLSGELAQRDGPPVAPGGRVVLRQHDVDGIAVKVATLDPRRPRVGQAVPFVAQHQVDVAQRERRQRLLGLGLDQLAAQAGSVAGERCDGGGREPDGHRLKGGDLSPPGDPPRDRRQLRLSPFRVLQHHTGVIDQDAGGIGQPHAASGALEQRYTGLALQHRQLLGHGGGRVLQRVGDRRDRSPGIELVQETQPPEVEHR